MRNLNLFLLFFLILNSFQLFAQVIYVDPQIAADCEGNYSIANRDCNGSDGVAYKTIQSAANAATAGTQVFLREGVYDEQLSPQNSGEENNYITFKNYENEVVEITGSSLNPAIWVEQKNYIVIEGIKIHDVNKWLNALGCNHLIIQNCTFENATNEYGSSKTGIFMQGSNHNIIRNNTISESTQDNIGLVDCDYNLIEGNTITKAEHTLWTLKCSNFNVIRGNYFHNEIQKIGEIYDCDGVGFGEDDFPKITSLDDTKYNVVENNTFAYTASSGDSSPYAGIQYAGQHGIIRCNTFYECVGPPIQLTLYADEATYNYSNRISHNVFFDNDFGGVDISGSEDYTFSDQIFKNNIFYKNQFVQNDTRWSWYEELDNKPVQIMTGRYDEISIENNNIFSSEVDELYTIAYGSRSYATNQDSKPLSWWEQYRSKAFKNNLQADPEFVDEDNKNFELQENSPMVDAGAFLATTTSSGTNSTVIEVDDAGWFIDGFGIVSGDTIKFEGQTDYVVIDSINYTTQSLIIDRTASWEENQGVSLKYYNTRPDVGAHEYYAITTGVEVGKSYDDNISIVPNPTGGSFKIESGSNNRVEKVVVFNGLGVQEKVAYSNEVNINHLESGIYYLKITSENGNIATKKVVKY
jgi:parallel beta-helix repeat protein